jgi:uncharacterized protein (TIGR03067 family)
MSRTIGLSLFCLVIAVAPAWADEKDDLKAMKGTWKVEKAVFMGSDATEIFKSVVLVIEDGKYTVTFAGQDDKGTMKLDAAKKPKRMTITGTEGPNKDKVIPCIYEIDGDTLKICYELDGKEPPTGFESKEGSKTLMATYKREKK